MLKIGTGLIVTLVAFTQFLSAMEFDFHPLSSLCRIEINLSTGFGSGKVRGNFEKIRGKISFSLENPGVSNGQIYLNARSFWYLKFHLMHRIRTGWIPKNILRFLLNFYSCPTLHGTVENYAQMLLAYSKSET